MNMTKQNNDISVLQNHKWAAYLSLCWMHKEFQGPRPAEGVLSLIFFIVLSRLTTVSFTDIEPPIILTGKTHLQSTSRKTQPHLILKWLHISSYRFFIFTIIELLIIITERPGGNSRHTQTDLTLLWLHISSACFSYVHSM